jgi:hypothetical protein
MLRKLNRKKLLNDKAYRNNSYRILLIEIANLLKRHELSDTDSSTVRDFIGVNEKFIFNLTFNSLYLTINLLRTIYIKSYTFPPKEIQTILINKLNNFIIDIDKTFKPIDFISFRLSDIHYDLYIREDFEVNKDGTIKKYQGEVIVDMNEIRSEQAQEIKMEKGKESKDSEIEIVNVEVEDEDEDITEIEWDDFDLLEGLDIDRKLYDSVLDIKKKITDIEFNLALSNSYQKDLKIIDNYLELIKQIRKKFNSILTVKKETLTQNRTKIKR